MAASNHAKVAMNRICRIKETSERKHVFLIDPFPVSRKAAADFLDETAGLTACGQADDAQAALQVIGRLKPDAAVTECPRRDGLEFIRELRRRHPRLPILVYSFGDEET